jgi:hypothetical protein
LGDKVYIVKYEQKKNSIQITYQPYKRWLIH